MCVNARYGGSSHDSFVWSLSNEKKFIEQKWTDGDRSSWLLGKYTTDFIIENKYF